MCLGKKFSSPPMPDSLVKTVLNYIGGAWLSGVRIWDSPSVGDVYEMQGVRDALPYGILTGPTRLIFSFGIVERVFNLFGSSRIFILRKCGGVDRAAAGRHPAADGSGRGGSCLGREVRVGFVPHGGGKLRKENFLLTVSNPRFIAV